MPDEAVLHSDQSGYWAFWCPGCKTAHVIQAVPAPKPWTFNGDPVRPTFSPSYLTWRDEEPQPFRCHSFITNGNIAFCSDCSHALAGQTVPLPPWRGWGGPDAE